MIFEVMKPTWHINLSPTLMTCWGTTQSFWIIVWRTACWPTPSYWSSSPTSCPYASCSPTACRSLHRAWNWMASWATCRGWALVRKHMAEHVYTPQLASSFKATINKLYKNFSDYLLDVMAQMSNYSTRDCQHGMASIISRLDFNGFYMECLFAERSQKVASHMPAPWGPQHQHPELLSLHSKALRALYLPQLKEGCGGPVGAVGKWVQSF